MCHGYISFVSGVVVAVPLACLSVGNIEEDVLLLSLVVIMSSLGDRSKAYEPSVERNSVDNIF